MGYLEITSTEIMTGKATSTSTASKIRNNFIDHEDRITDIENGMVVDYPPIVMSINGRYDLQGSTHTDLIRTTANFNLTITGVRIVITKAGASGTTEVDLLIKSGVGAFATIFSTKPSVSYSAEDNAVSSNGILGSNINMLAGDLLRLDITSVQSGGIGFIVRIDYERT